MSRPRRFQSRHDQPLIRTARWRARDVRLAKTSEGISEKLLVERVELLSRIVAMVAQGHVNAHWTAAGIIALLDPKAPPFAYKAMEAAHGRPILPTGLHLDSRALRITMEVSGRTLRSAGYQKEAVENVLSGRSSLIADAITRRNTRRSITRFLRTHGHAPTNFFELRPDAPVLRRPSVPLSCTDRQFAEWQIDANHETAILRLKLPIVAHPTKRADWVWHELILQIPGHTRARLDAGGRLRLPTLRAHTDRVLLDVPVEFPPETTPATNTPERVLGLDWGERRLLTGSIIQSTGADTAHEVMGPFIFDARGAQQRMERHRALARHLRTIQDRIRRLDESRAVPSPILAQRLGTLERERERVWQARADLQSQLAHHAARWAVHVAVTHGATVIAIEDLRALEPRLRGRRLRDRLNHQIRGVLAKHLADKAAEAGITLRVVNPRGTSALCPTCGAAHAHVRAPDTTKPGRGWALCDECGASRDRDHAASMNIAARALTRHNAHQPRIHSQARPRISSNSTIASRPRRTRSGQPGSRYPGTTTRTTQAIPGRNHRCEYTTRRGTGLTLVRTTQKTQKVQLNT